MPTTAPAYTIGGITRPELHFDATGHILLEAVVVEFIWLCFSDCRRARRLNWLCQR